MPRCRLRRSALIFLLTACGPAAAQTPTTAPAQPAARENPYFAPVADGLRIRSMGQPPLIAWHASMLGDFGADAALAAIGVQKSFLNPLAGVLAVRAEGLVGGGREGLEGGARLLAVSPLSRLHVGLDYDARRNRLDWVAGAEFNIRRGGIFGMGTRLRVSWLPGRDTLQAGITVPVGQRAGRTRPKSDRVRLPAARPARMPVSGRLDAALREFRAAADDVHRLVVPMHTRVEVDPAKAVAPDVAAVRALPPSDRVLARMIAAWPAVFRAALDADDAGGPADLLSTRARRIVLEDVLLPFDGLFGQRRTNGTLYVFAAAATERFSAEVATAGLTGSQRAAAMAAFHAVLQSLDAVRSEVRRLWHSDRRVFMPLQLALAPDESDSQDELDALIERAVGDRFIDGNRIYYIINEAFQFEFARTVALAERYHVLWIHDVRATGESGRIDRVAALQAKGYLQALTDRIRRYDETRTLPQYFIILDQYFYETNRGRQWMSLLERPLSYDIRFPEADDEVARDLRQSQAALRAAVAGSARLQAGRARFGEAWLQNVVKVHVNVTHPADFSFWGRGLFPLLGMPDNLMRDHRKIVFYDLDEQDPARGEVIFSGMGIGEHYAGATWEDRAIIVRGPAALPIKAAARRLLERNGFTAAELPPPFAFRAPPPDFDARVDAARTRLTSSVVPFARVLQSHNDAGFGEKKASVSKAILLSVMPAGSVLISPDSLWEDVLWGSLAMGSALRGCRVLVIAPSTKNAPGASALVMARMHMLVSRLLAMSKALEPQLTAAGGLLRTGLFNESSAVGDMGERAREAHRRFEAAGSWLKTLIPFSQATMDAWLDHANDISKRLPPSYLTAVPDEVRPKLHMKGLYAMSRSAWDGLLERPEMTATLVEYLEQRGRQVSGAERDVRALPEAVWAARRQLLDAHAAALNPAQAASVVRYLQIGSFNMNDRSMLLDGEVELTVSGLAAQSGMLDFIVICGLTEWVDSQEHIDRLIAPPGKLIHLVARWGRSVL